MQEIVNSEPTVQKFMSSIPNESKVAVIIPLYGFWNDAQVEQMTGEVLNISLQRLKSNKHKIYSIFVGEPNRLTSRVKKILNGYQAAGNVKAVQVPEHSSYAEYLKEGFETVMQETDAQFIVVFNPWAMLKEDSLDQMLERINRGDVGIVSGYDLNGVIDPSAFDVYDINLPKEEFNIDINFMGMTRQFLEMLRLDMGFKTHYLLGRDFWQSLATGNYPVIVSQFIPFYTFDIDWTLIEDAVYFEQDRQYFIDKWRFDAGVKFTKDGK